MRQRYCQESEDIDMYIDNRRHRKNVNKFYGKNLVVARSIEIHENNIIGEISQKENTKIK